MTGSGTPADWGDGLSYGPGIPETRHWGDPVGRLQERAEKAEAECERLRAALDKLKRQQWSNQNRAEVAERGHKACLARESEYLVECERLRAALKEPCAECGHIDWREFGVADDE